LAQVGPLQVGILQVAEGGAPRQVGKKVQVLLQVAASVQVVLPAHVG